MNYAEYIERVQEAGARLQNARQTEDFAVYPNMKDGCPEAPFPLDGETHSVLALMEPTRDDGVPTKAALFVGHGDPSPTAFRLRMATFPVDVVRYNDGSGIKQINLVYFQPNMAAGEAEKTIGPPKPKPVVLPDAPPQKTRRQRAIDYLLSKGIGVWSGLSDAVVFQIAAQNGFTD